MKRIYLLLVLLVALVVETYAQSADLQIITTWTLRQGGNKLLVSGGPAPYPGKDTFFYTFKNYGPDSIKATDTIYIKTNYGTIYAMGNTIKKDSSKRYYNDVNLVPTTQASQTITAQQRCDSIWVKRGSAILPDPVIANNDTCNTFVTTYWKAGIDDLEKAKPMSVYPNPASGFLNIKYDFSNNSTAAIVVRDMIGKIVYEKDFGRVSGEKELKIDINALQMGIYIVELHANDNIIVSKVSVQ